MKIEYQEGGSESRLVITSGFLWWRKHIHLVDEILLRAPQLRAVSEGFFYRDDDRQWIYSGCATGGNDC